jgi:hypothetical protein
MFIQYSIILHTAPAPKITMMPLPLMVTTLLLLCTVVKSTSTLSSLAARLHNSAVTTHVTIMDWIHSHTQHSHHGLVNVDSTISMGCCRKIDANGHLIHKHEYRHQKKRLIKMQISQMKKFNNHYMIHLDSRASGNATMSEEEAAATQDNSDPSAAVNVAKHQFIDLRNYSVNLTAKKGISKSV